MPANTGVAPICNAKPEQPNFNSLLPATPRFSMPNFHNPRSLAAAILQLQQAVAALSGSSPPANNTIGGSPIGGPGGGVAGGGGGKQVPPDPNDWSETGRVTENVKVVNPDDDSQFVIVKEIVSITFERSSTGEKIVIKRDPK
jgi:hypothetical protein